MEQYLYLVIIGLTILGVLYYIYHYHKKWFWMVWLRLIFGITAILVLDYIFQTNQINCFVGVNPVSIVILALLGVPGLILLFGGVFLFPLF